MGAAAETEEQNVFNPAMAPKLTKWEKEPTAQELQGDLEAAKPAHDTFVNNIKRWRDLTSVSGSAKPPKIRGRSQVQPKLIRRQAEWRYPALTEPFNSSDKLFEVSPVTFEDRTAAQQNELVLNWQFRTKINRVNFIDNYVRSCVDEGTAIIRLGWSRITQEVEETVPVWTYMEPQSDEEIQVLEQAIMLKQENPRGYNEGVDEAVKVAVDFFEENGVPCVAVQTGTEKIKTEKILDNRPTLGMMAPENIYFDPSCGGDLEKAGFVIATFETSQAELKKEPNRYKNLEHVNWEGASTVLEHEHMPQSTDENFNFKDSLRKRVVAHEYWGDWDIHGDGNLVPIVATWIGNTLVRLEENPFPDKKPPFVAVSYMPIKRQVMGEPDAELLEDNQKILGAVTRGMIDLLGRSANSQQGFAKGMLDVVNRRRYENGQDYEFNPNMPPQQGIIEHKYPDIPQSAMLMLQLQNQEAEALTGVKAFSGGLSGEAFGQVATGIRGIIDAAAKREMTILRRLADGLVIIGRKICAMNAVFLSEEEIVRVTNEDFITVRREDLEGHYDLKVDISTAEIDANKAQDLAFLLQTTGNTLEFGIVKMILVELARLKRMPDLAKMVERYEPQPDPFQEQMKQLQLQREMKEIEKLDSEIALNQSRALREQTGAEKAALDTVEQETGTKHARDMEKQTAQSTGNQSLEVTKALLKGRKPEESRPDIEGAVGFNELTRQTRDVRGAENPPGLTNIMSDGLSPRGNDFRDPLDPTLTRAINN